MTAMANDSGRSATAGTWPQPRAVWTIAALIGALAAGAAAAGYQYASTWTALQRAYLPQYVRASVLEALGVRSASRPRELLSAQVYAGRTPADLLKPALVCTLVTVLVLLPIAISRDLRRLRQSRHGRRLKGPELVTTRRFHRLTRADGVGFLQHQHAHRRSSWLRIPRALESSHILVMGDSGTGKSALIRQVLLQLEERGDTAIVYDPALEYTAQFYRPDRGDVILNPLDARSPYWTPGDEWRLEAETLTMAISFFPDRHQDNAFFTEAPRRIFAHLLTMRPSPEQLSAWLADEDEMDRRLAGTPYASMIDRNGPAQRSGVLASLNMVADTLKLLPRQADTSLRWSASRWADQWPHGWLFLTSTPETRSRLVPLMSLWLDLLVLRLMNRGQPREHPTWFALDELASLQRLPQLHTAITENRKSNNPVILGFQGRSQLETRYGHDAEAMLSQPATKIFLRTSEPRAARWIAETIGDIETERLRESRSLGSRGQRQLGLERHVEPLVMASEISGLPALHGFLKLGNLVVPLATEFVRLPARAEALVERRDRIERAARPGQGETAAPAIGESGLALRADRAIQQTVEQQR